jgi:hypothetical protein
MASKLSLSLPVEADLERALLGSTGCSARRPERRTTREDAIMPTTGRLPRRLSDEDLQKMLALTKDADSVELKLTVPDANQRSAVTALGMDPLDGQIRQAYFFDTPDLACNKQGVVVRARRVQRRHDDSVIKLRPVVPGNLPADLRSDKHMVVEVDMIPGGYVCSASLKGVPDPDAIQAVAAGDRPIRTLFSEQQQAFYDAHAPEGVGLDDLTLLGPINLIKLKFTPGDFGRRLVAELWLYPDGSRILELSTKCPPSETFQAAAETRAFLAARGVDLTGEQQTKTSTALEFFSQHLKATADA